MKVIVLPIASEQFPKPDGCNYDWFRIYAHSWATLLIKLDRGISPAEPDRNYASEFKEEANSLCSNFKALFPETSAEWQLLLALHRVADGFSPEHINTTGWTRLCEAAIQICANYAGEERLIGRRPDGTEVVLTNYKS